MSTPVFYDLPVIRAEYRRGWQRAIADGIPKWRRWAALNEVATWLAEGIAQAVVHEEQVDEHEVDLYRRVDARRLQAVAQLDRVH